MDASTLRGGFGVWCSLFSSARITPWWSDPIVCRVFPHAMSFFAHASEIKAMSILMLFANSLFGYADLHVCPWVFRRPSVKIHASVSLQESTSCLSLCLSGQVHPETLARLCTSMWLRSASPSSGATLKSPHTIVVGCDFLVVLMCSCNLVRNSSFGWSWLGT